ncbi:MAG: peptide deformylase [Sphaerochaetaceae bacterium]|nr:peptide deformylase [Sphaerochaetaceae bacterium]MDC7237610.1 peptide deformylase [Sphaerochaetaceae bacterium]MDC7250641.1 peptide deformylase [Sphaerochaetaceae bacterium]
MLEIYTIGEEILREKCKKVDKFDSALELLVNAMFEKMDEADGVGLAAPQVGVDLRVFVIDDHRGVRKAFINPEIVETSMEECSMEEGCLSIPGVYTYLTRSKKVTVQAQDVKGKTFRLEADDLLARAVQHENDHLNGVLFVDRLDEKSRIKLIRTYERKNKLKRGSVE